ncbi:MAG TPA: DUF3667 domain-containing protein [Gemmatimonadaceae bacterium]|nr:DUF3667 domain-containing protein [Gemmatimonadaceae bacterium]
MELVGRYCHACGQKETDADPRLSELAHEAADEFFHWDGKLITTLAALFRRPGLLTAEYLAGRRARYVSPLRLYLTASVVYFAVLALIPRTSTVRFQITDDERREAHADSIAKARARAAAADSAKRAVTGKLESPFARVSRDPAKFQEAFLHNRPKAMFVLLPVFALALRALYRRQGRYPAHFIFALHLHAFAFLVLAAIGIPAAFSKAFDVLEPIAITAIVVYLVLALRRVHRESWPRTLLKTGALAMAYVLVFAATLVGLLALTAYTFA